VTERVSDGTRTRPASADSPFSLAGRTALVTGGNGGLGFAIARGLRSVGAIVAVTGRDTAKNETAIGELGGEAVFELDVRDEQAVEAVVRGVVTRFGSLDILVNNAGVGRAGFVDELRIEEWDEVVGSHLRGAFVCSKHAVPHMRARGGGKIVNVGSMFSLFGPPGFSPYAAAKTGILGLTRALAVELAPTIQVNAMLPGWFETDLTRSTRASPRGDEIRRRTPAGRWGEPSDFIWPVIFLASAASDFVTGVALPVDGGYAVSERLLHD
jgi:2-dehydro-3-deoxy-D-gluconate 5-dehydrogenase